MLIEKPRIPIREILCVGILPGFLKKLVYRLRGYRFGRGVRLGFGAVIVAERAAVGDHTRVGFFTILRGREIEIGRHVQIGALVFIDTPYVRIGDGSKFNEQVYVGGLQFPDSAFVCGRNCQVMQMTFINPAVAIEIGDDTGIGGHCLIFGHTSWLSAFEGYPVEFKPIRIGASVSIAWGAFLLPGAEIGDGAVVGARSVVSREIPPRCLAVGFPARVVSRFPEFPRPVSDEEKAALLRRIVEEMLAYFRGSGLLCREAGGVFEVARPRRGGGRYTLTVADAPIGGPPPDPAGRALRPDVLISLRAIPEAERARLAAQGTLWIDIENKAQADIANPLGAEVLLFLKRYGVRCIRVGAPAGGRPARRRAGQTRGEGTR